MTEPNTEHRTGWHLVTRDQRGRERWQVRVVGTRGSFSGIRSSYDDAKHTALRYARLLDAPRHVLDDTTEAS